MRVCCGCGETYSERSPDALFAREAGFCFWCGELRAIIRKSAIDLDSLTYWLLLSLWQWCIGKYRQLHLRFVPESAFRCGWKRYRIRGELPG